MLGPLLAVALAAYAPQQAGSEPLAPALEARVQKLGKEIRCAVCQGMAIADSPASMARSQLDKVRELVSACKTDDEIKEYFVARYGEWALLRPKAEGMNLVVWLAPALLVLAGLAIVVVYVKRQPKPPSAPPPAPPGGANAPEDPYLRAVRSELDR